MTTALSSEAEGLPPCKPILLSGVGYGRMTTYPPGFSAFFLNLEMAHPDRVIASRIETFDRDLDRLLNFLGVEQKARPSAIPHRVVNASQRGSGRGSLDTYAGEIAERRGKFAHLSRKPQGAPVIRDRPNPRPATRDGLPRSRF